MQKGFKLILLLGALAGVFSVFGQIANFSASPTTVCVGSTVQFTNTSTGATTYSWTFADGGTGQTSTAQNPVITYNTPGVYNVSLTASNGTASNTETKAAYITVITAATATLTSGAGSANPFVCIGSPLPSITYDVTGATGAVFSGLPVFCAGSFIPTATGGTVVISGTPNPIGTYNYSFTTTGTSCTPVTVNGTITVVPSTTIGISSGPAYQSVCLNTSITTVVFNIGGAPTSVTVSGLPAGVTGVLSGSTFTISGSPSQTGSFVYTVTASGGPCSQVEFYGSMDVGPHLQLSSAPSTANQTLCINAPLGNIIYTLGSGITGATITGLPPGITGTYNPGLFLITFSPTAGGIYNYTLTTSGGACGSATASGSITVNILPTLSQNVPGVQNQTLCEGTPITNITYSVGGSATGATVTGLPAGITGTFNAGVFTLSGSSTVGGTHNFTVSTTGSPCGTLTLTGTIVIHKIPQLNLISPIGSNNQEVCVNTPMDSVIYQLTGTATAISVINLPAGINSNVVNGTVFIFGTPTAIGSYTYTVFTSGGTCPPDTVYGLITTGIPPALNLTSVPGSNNQTICLNDAITPMVYTISGAADTAVVSGLPPGVNAVFLGNNLTISGTPAVSGTYSFTVIASGGFCPSVSLTGQLVVHNPQISLVSPAGSNLQNLCIDASIDPIVYVFSGGATGAIALNLPPGLTSLVQNDTLYIFGTASQAGNYAFIVHTTGTACEADTNYGVINIDAFPSVTLISGVNSDQQEVFVNESIQTIVYLLNGSADTAVVSGLPPGVTAVFSGDSLIISGSPSTIGLWTYGILATGGLCVSDTIFGVINVIPKIESLNIEVPNVFSPNNDDTNDIWFVSTEYVEKIELVILNRYGNIMFESEGPTAAWDGKNKKGVEAKEGVYYYKMTVFGKDASITPLHGFFHLVR